MRQGLTAATLATFLFVLAGTLALAGCGESSSGDENAGQRELQRLEEEAREEKLSRLQRQLREERKREAILKTPASSADPPAEAPTSTATGADLAGFAALEESLPGQVGITIGPPGSGPAASAGRLTIGSAWSTAKVPVALRVIEEVGGPSGLSTSQQEEIRAALTASDNEAALSLFGDLEAIYGGPEGAAAAVTEVLAEAGDPTQISSQGRDGFTPFGQTEWSLTMQELFMSHLAAGCIVSPAASDYVLDLMGEVSSDTWGLGSTGLVARWKGGWGPGTDGRYLARQMGVLSTDGGEVVIALAALPDDGSFETAQSMATSVAQWAAEKAAPDLASTATSC